MSKKSKHWILANIAGALFGYCALQVIRYDGGWFYMWMALLNFYIVYINVDAANNGTS